MAQSHSLRTFVSVVLATFALTAVSFCQSTQTAQTVKWDNYVFKFLPGGQMAQVMNSDGNVIGTILQMNGELRVIPVPGPEAEKLTKSFQDWKTFNARAHAGDSPAAATTTAGTTAPAASQAESYCFDGAQ